MKKIYEVIVVGSGPSGVTASDTLTRVGVDVCMIDGGIFDNTYERMIPNKSFVQIRKEEMGQHEYFLGKNLEGIQFDEIKTGAQLTPPRQYIAREVDTLTPTSSPDFARVESLARGGLGGAWGLGAFVLTKKEIRALGLPPESLKVAYREIVARIGVSGGQDDGTPFCLSDIDTIQPATTMEPGIEKLYDAYLKKRNALNAQRLFMGRAPLALLTKPLGERRPTEYHDMDFWSNEGGSAYRPGITLDALEHNKHFTYCGGFLVTRFKEEGGVTTVSAINIKTKETMEFFCKKLILCAGVLGTARIVLRSMADRSQTLPIVSGSYVYYPCIQPRTFGIGTVERKISYGQLALFYDKNEDALEAATVQFYTYSSLMLQRLAPELPINFSDVLALLRLGAPNLIVAGVHQPGTRGERRYVKLVPDETSITGDRLIIHYEESSEEEARHERVEGIIRQALRSLGCFPVRRINPGYGASIHYGGTLPFDESRKPFTLSTHGKLADTNDVYVADGSGFQYVPSKGPTLTLMANAHTVALHIAETLNKRV